jgi:primosomal protein N' (replication factor Y)
MQSYDPEHPALRCAADQDYAAFFVQEAAERKELAYPPYGHLVEIEIKGRVKDRVMESAGEIRRALARIATGTDVSVLGPAPKAVSRIKRQERWHVLLRSPSRKALRGVLDRALPGLRERRPGGIHVAVDVDPRHLL